MNALVNFNSQLTMSSREIAELVSSSHDNVLKTVRRLMDGGVIPKTTPHEYIHPQNKQPYEEFFFDKRSSLIVVARLSPEFTAAVVDRWQELENSNKPSIPQTYAAALLEAGRLALEVEKQAEQLAIAAPKVKIVDEYMNREALQNATQVAQTFKMSAVKMNRVLDEIGGIYNKSVKRGRAFCQSFIDNGYGKMIQNEIGYPQAMFTTSGIVELTRIMHSEGVI